jgi:hypothetical protein
VSFNSSINNKAILVLKISCFFLLMGRAYQHLFWDIPLRSFFWDEGLLRQIVEGVSGASWQEVITSKAYDNFILGLQNVFGGILALAAIAALFAERIGKRIALIFPLSSILLTLLALLYWKERFFQIPQFFEYSIQMLAPLLLYLLLYRDLKPRRLFFLSAGAIALTFTAHGFYALNLYPRPGKFVDMTINIMGFSETGAINFLIAAGWLDIIFAIGIFFKISRKISLYYCMIWGFLTALARVVAYVEFATFADGFHQYAFETAMRLVHGGLPLMLLIELFQIKDLRNNQ